MRFGNGLKRSLVTALAAALLSGCGGSAKDREVELTVSAAASLQRSLDRIEAAYEAANPGVKLTINYGPSGALQKQIEQGAPVDLFLSAGAKQMDALEAKKLVSERVDLLANTLVVAAPGDGGQPIGDLSDLASARFRSVAIGDPATVPAGEYAEEALRASGLWERLEPKFVFGKDVRQVMTYVESGNTDAGFVYKTDAIAAGAVVLYEVPAALHEPIRYPAGVVAASEHPEEAASLLDYLRQDEARSAFEADGFQAIGDTE